MGFGFLILLNMYEKTVYNHYFFLVTISLVEGVTKSITGICLIPSHANPDEFIRCKFPGYTVWILACVSNPGLFVETQISYQIENNKKDGNDTDNPGALVAGTLHSIRSNAL